MEIDKESVRYLEKKWGMRKLPTNVGVKAFDKLLSQGIMHGLVAYGDGEEINKKLLEIKSDVKIGISSSDVISVSTLEELEHSLIGIFSKLLKLDKEHLDSEIEFSEYGVDSIMMMKILNLIEDSFAITIEPTAIVNYPTIQLLAKYLREELGVQTNSLNEKGYASNNATTFKVTTKTDSRSTRRSIEKVKNGKVAIIGMSCRLPGANNIQEYWENLKEGKDLIGDVPKERWNALDYYTPGGGLDKSYTDKGGFIKNAGFFDGVYFGISNDEAISMDPQQRIVLEMSRDLVAHAGYIKEELQDSNTGVYIGAKNNNYVINNYHHMPKGSHKRSIVNNISNMIAARVSDFYDLKGASQIVDTACSSSLVAINQACDDILSGRSKMAIAGGISIMVDAFNHIGFSQAEVLSRDGRSYVFDERAKGFVMGEGGGLVLLKSYEDAISDGDQIYGIISGSSVNNDGKTMGLTVPNKEGQKEVISKALSIADIDPNDITYYEAHGTGTLLGDPIEVKAVTEVYQSLTVDAAKKQYCAMGSVKSNLGHTMTAAGVTGLIKILLQLKYKTLVPTLHCDKPHPRFKFDQSPFYPNTELKPWELNFSNKRIAAISSFGFGGTNCHMIIEEEKQEIVKRKSLPVERLSNNYYWLGQDIVNLNGSVSIQNGGVTLLKTETFSHNEAYLRDHIVNHNQVILGVTYASLLIESLKKENQSLMLKGLLFKNPVLLEKMNKTVIKVYSEQSTGKLSVTSQINTEAIVEVATGKVLKSNSPSTSIKEVLEKTITNPERILNKEAIYASENQSSVWHGKSLRIVEKVFISSEVAIGDLQLNTGLLSERSYDIVHPALLNAGLMTGLTLVQEEPINFLPLMIKQLMVFAPVEASCYVYAQLVKSNREVLELNYQLCDKTGTVLVDIIGFVCKRVHDRTNLEPAKGMSLKANKIDIEHIEIQSAEAFLRKELSEFVKEDVDMISSERNFMDLGVDSGELISLVGRLEKKLKDELYPTLFFEYQNIAELSAYLTKEYPKIFGITSPHLEKA